MQPAFELGAIDQAGERIMRRLVRQLPSQHALVANIAEYQHGAGHLALAVLDGGCGVVNGDA